jgi:hypothetical protein
MEKKVCLDCGEPIKGRSDKKFCNDICRNSYNNKLNSDTNNYVRNVNNILRRNRRILEELLDDKTKLTVQKQKLSSKGFDFNFYTNQRVTKEVKHYFFCYEYGYLFLENDLLLLVKNEPFTPKK